MKVPWVVYSIPGQPCRAVCSQAEWARLNSTKPEYYTFIRGGISHEGEAERLARGTAGDRLPVVNQGTQPTTRFEPWYQTLTSQRIAPLG